VSLVEVLRIYVDEGMLRELRERFGAGVSRYVVGLIERDLGILRRREASLGEEVTREGSCSEDKGEV